jgi:hypothetical protein
MVIYLTHHLNTTFEDIAFFLATRYMQFLLSLLAPFKQWWACRRKASMTRFNIYHHGLVHYCNRWGGDISHHFISPTNMSTTPYPMNTSSKTGKYHAILRPWISISQTAGLFTAYLVYRRKGSTPTQYQADASYITARDWFTQPHYNRVPCIVGQILGRLRFRRTNLCDLPRLRKGIIHINLLGPKRMGESG